MKIRSVEPMGSPLKWPLERLWRFVNIGVARGVAFALCALSVPFAAGPASAEGRWALVVGVQEYKYIPAPQEELRLQGMTRDLQRIQRTLRNFGYTDKEIKRISADNATQARIRSEMAAILEQAKAGDSVVFYFSGRGSVAYDPAKPNLKDNLEPTLAPYDAMPDRADRDIRMSELEAWATKLTAKKAQVTLLLDSCYQGKSAQKGEGRALSLSVRGVPRPSAKGVTGGKPRVTLYKGPGILLAATSARGYAYEWRENATGGPEDWSGVFTDLVCGNANRLAVEKRNAGPSAGDANQKSAEAPVSLPTFGEVMSWVQGYVKMNSHGGDYLAGQTPLSVGEQENYQNFTFLNPAPLAASANASPATPTVVVVPPPPPDVKRDVEREVAALRESERRLRVVVDIRSDDAAVCDRMLAEAAPTLKAYFAGQNATDIEFLPRYGAKPDRVLEITPLEGGKMRVRVTGGAAEQFYDIVADRQPNLGSALSERPGPYLMRQALIKRLYQLTAPDNSPTLPAEWSADSDASAYAFKADLFYRVKSDTAGWFYLLDEDGTGVHLTVPSAYTGTLRQRIGAQRWPAEENMEAQSPPGVVTNRAILIRPTTEMDQNSLDPPPGLKQWNAGDKIDLRYWDAELRHLRALVAGIESKRIQWSARTFTYRMK